MKRGLCFILCCALLFSLYGCGEHEKETFQCDAKPVIYLYPEETTNVQVKLNYAGELFCTFPEYRDGWNVTAQPDGRLTDLSDGKEYSYLFWEGQSDTKWDFSKGFVIKGKDTAEFLQTILPAIGLQPREYNEMIVYWLPNMQNNAYNLISFQTDRYAETAALDISPAPDTILRVFMAWKPLEKPVEILPQKFSAFERTGFTVVEWGGVEVH